MNFTNLKNQARGESYIISRSILILIASMSSNVFAYLFQLLSGRYLSVEDYSKLVSLFGLSAILLMFVGFFTGGLTKLVAEIKDVDYPTKISSLFITVTKFHFIYSLLFLILMFLSTNLISNYLKIYELNLLIAFAFAIFAGNLTAFFASFLQGLMRFKAFSLSIFLGAFTRFLTIVTVIFMGLGVIDIFWGLAVTTLGVGAINWQLLKKNIRFDFRLNDFADFKILVMYSLLSAIGMAGMTIIQNGDVVIVKNLFNETLAGIYGSTSVIGRIVFFASSPVAMVMLPMCAEKYKKGQDFIKPFLFSLTLSVAIAICVAGVFAFYPHLVIDFLFGQKYLPALEFLSAYSFYMVVYTILNLFTAFFISISKFRYASISILAPVVSFSLIKLIYNQNLMQVITTNTYAVILVILLQGVFILNVIKKEKYADQ